MTDEELALWEETLRRTESEGGVLDYEDATIRDLIRSLRDARRKLSLAKKGLEWLNMEHKKDEGYYSPACAIELGRECDCGADEHDRKVEELQREIG